ncbi:MAG: phage holin family protein [Anaerolineae bacterium]|nr:phage holin family protein [Anaerolineae bacterium]
MRGFILRLIINGIAIAVVAALLPGITVVNDDLGTLAVLALIIALVNALVKPVIIFLGCPFIILSLGLLIPIINGLLLLLTAALSGGRLIVDGLGWAILGGLIMGIVSMVLEGALGVKEDRREEQRQRR